MRQGDYYISVTFEVTPEGRRYVSECKELGIASCGDDIQEAFDNILEASELTLNAWEEMGIRARKFSELGVRMKQFKRLKRKPPSRAILVPPDSFVTHKKLPVPV